jgi:acyl dehydratase
MTRGDFPFPVLGLVHVSNRIETLAPLRLADRPALTVRAAALGPHPRGRQIDVVTEAHVDGACVWREHSTYLRREPARPPSGPRRRPAWGDARSVGEFGAGAALWTVPALTARRYAQVSGDRNPIHTSRLAARAFGFRRRIAHGMWTAARSLAALEGRLPATGTVEVHFQRPLLLPGRAAFTSTPTGTGWAVTLTDPHTGRPHLTGTVRSTPGPQG